MKRWKIEGIIEDDGIIDPSGDIKDKYYDTKELKEEFEATPLTAGLTLKITKITLIRKGGGSNKGANTTRKRQ